MDFIYFELNTIKIRFPYKFNIGTIYYGNFQITDTQTIQ